MGLVAKRVHLPPVEGNSDEMYRLAAEEKGVVVSANFARLHDAHMGEVLEIPAPAGMLRLPIVGVVDDFSDQQGTLLLNRDLFIRYWHDDSVNVFRVYVDSGRRCRASPAAHSSGVRQPADGCSC